MFRPSHKWQSRSDQFILPPGGWVLTISVLLSIVLAGGRPLWAQGIVTCGVALLWLLWPPEFLPKRAIIIALVILAIAPLAAYLPLSWTSLPAWRQALNNQPAITASAFITPQPWLAFHNWLLWLTGIALAAWCASQSWEYFHRTSLARVLSGGLVVITAFAILAPNFGINPDFWKSTDGFGPFINRNQWGTLLGLGGIMSIALVHQSIRRENKRALFFWLAAFLLFVWAILMNGSRGGLVVLATGGFAYWTFFGLINNNYRYAAIALSFLFVSFAVFSLGGGVMLERFVDLKNTFETGGEDDFRTQFYRMVLNLSGDAKLTGFGLGNFSYVFPFYLDFQPMMNRRPLHPESSWLWILSEGGWISILALTGVVALFFKFSYEARRSRAATIRSAGMAIAVAFIINAFFEVSAHRIGTLFPAIVLASLALPSATSVVFSKSLLSLLRIPGLLLGTVGFVWFASGYHWVIAPSIQGVSVLQTSAGIMNEGGKTQEAIEILDEAETLEPLNWDIRWARGSYLLQIGDQNSAWNEFRAAQAILPYMAWVLESEGYAWSKVNPSRAAYAWKQAMELSEPGRRSQMYLGYLRAARQNPLLYAALQSLYPDDPDMEFQRIANQERNPLPRLLRLVKKTENLNTAPDNIVASILSLLQRLRQHELIENLTQSSTRIKRLGWEVLSSIAASNKKYDEALALYFEYGTHPALPAPISRSDLRTIERAAALAPMDISTAISYYQGLEFARRKEDAFWQLRRIMELPDAPPYIWYLAAKAAYAHESFEEAWEYLQTYKRKTEQ